MAKRVRTLPNALLLLACGHTQLGSRLSQRKRCISCRSMQNVAEVVSTFDGEQRRAEQRAARELRNAVANGAVTKPADLDEAVIEETWARLSPNDSAYRPTSPDPLERGPARVSPRTAKAARRRKATTRYEIDHDEG